MKNVIKDAFYIGVCTAAVTKHFVEAEVKRYMDAGHISPGEGKRIVDKAMKEVYKKRKSFEKTAKAELKRGIKEARPLVNETKKLVGVLAAEILREAKGAAKSGARMAVVKVKKKVAGRLSAARKTARMIRSKARKAAPRAVKVVRKIRKRIKR